MKKISVLVSLFILALYLQGCLTVETKEYTFNLKSGLSGEGKIKYINIIRSVDSTSTLDSDYEELIGDFLNGNKPENDFIGVKNVKKRLFEEDNRLCGEVTFEFGDITRLKFFNYNNNVWAYNISSGSGIFGGTETYFSSNGTYAGDNFPVVFWDGDQKSFELKTTVSASTGNTVSLLDIWKKKGEERK